MKADERYTVDGSDDLEARLARNCQVTLAGVKRLIPAGALDGLLLAGGYGRGEGGVLRTPAGDQPYHDMEFYVFVNGSAILAERKYRQALDKLGESLSNDAGLKIAFKAVTCSKLRRSPVNMFYYDLAMGHRWALGDDRLLARCDHHRDATKIPLHEATRLLFNRCSGLLFSKARLKQDTFSQKDADFIGRNCAKVQLAMGDALLTAGGQYHWSCRERSRRLAASPDSLDEDLMKKARAHHEKGVRFKLHPEHNRLSRAEIEKLHREIGDLAGEVWLGIERKRLKGNYRDAREYGVSGANKCPETWGARNRLVNARAFGMKTAFGKLAGRYPRERLFNALALMLWMDDSEKDNRLLSTLQTNLRTKAETFADLVKAYEVLWLRFN